MEAQPSSQTSSGVCVTDVVTRRLAIPHIQPYHWTVGAPEGHNSVIVEIRTDAGFTGTGESCGARSADAVAAAIEGVRHLVVGSDPFEITRTMQRVLQVGNWSNHTRFANQAFAGVEMALLDICGKITGQPVANLLGGRVRDEISWFGFLQGREPTALASHATELKEAGFEIFYLKVGLDAKRDVEAVRLVREALGEEARIRVDANEAWDRLHAVRMIRRLHEHRIEWVEQPLVWYDTEGLAWLQDQVEPIIVPDQAIFLESEALMAVRRNLAPVFVVGFHESGGLLALKRIAAIANAGGVALNRHAVLGESGISTLAAIQVLATIPNLTDGNQVMDGLYNEDVLTTRPDTGSGRSLVGRDPGFGIDLDWAKVEYFSRLYAEIGQYPMCVN